MKAGRSINRKGRADLGVREIKPKKRLVLPQSVGDQHYGYRPAVVGFTVSPIHRGHRIGTTRQYRALLLDLLGETAPLTLQEDSYPHLYATIGASTEALSETGVELLEEAAHKYPYNCCHCHSRGGQPRTMISL